MDKKQYAKILAERLVYILNEEIRLSTQRERVVKKIQNYNMSIRDLTDFEQKIYFNNGYSKSAIARVRIELNKVLLEIAKGE